MRWITSYIQRVLRVVEVEHGFGRGGYFDQQGDWSDCKGGQILDNLTRFCFRQTHSGRDGQTDRQNNDKND